MKRPYQVTGLVIVVFAIAVMYESLQLAYYTKLGPGPGYFPFWVGVIVGMLGSAMVYAATIRGADPLPQDFVPSRSGIIKLAVVLAVLVWTIVMMKPLGFRLTTLVFFGALLPVLGYAKWIKVITVSLVGSFGIFYVFDTVLGMSLPIGILGF